MTDETIPSNVYHNVVTGATPNPLIDDPDAIDQEFASAANQVLAGAVELIRTLIGAHQSGAAVVIHQDWRSIRKYFSLSAKYAAWADYAVPATGYGIHAWLLKHNQPVRLTQAELEAHPEWRNFGDQADRHPPMRGWLAVPLIDRAGVNWGLLQLSDKYAGEFSAQDEQQLVDFAKLVSTALEALWEIRNLKKATPGAAPAAAPR